MKNLITSFAALLMSMTTTVSAMDTLPSPKSVLDQTSCTSFQWISHEGFSDKAAIKVPVSLDGQQYWFQLDTGSDSTMLYGVEEAQKRGWNTSEEGFARVNSVQLGGTTLGPVQILLNKEMDTDGDVVGTVGLDALVGKVAILDFPGERFCLLSSLDVPESVQSRTTSVPTEIRDGKFFLKPEIGGKDFAAVFYDTGSSAFSLVVDLESWRQVARNIGDKDTTKIVVPSWGQQVTMIGAPAKDIQLGAFRPQNPMVFYLPDQPELFKGWPFQAAGLMGNAMFQTQIVVLNLGAHPSFGILR